MKQYHQQYNINIKDLEDKMKVLEPTHQLLEAERLRTRELEEKLGELENIQSQTKLQADKSMEVARMEKESWTSQNLQMELEKIRQSEKEVRWQHEDDVSECAGCNLQLVGKKENCRHCGKIFCENCLQKKVTSG